MLGKLSDVQAGEIDTGDRIAGISNGCQLLVSTGSSLNRIYKDFLLCQACIEFGVGYFISIDPRTTYGRSCNGDREQTAHLQAALLHLPVRAQIRTAQPDSIRGTWFSAIAATHGLSSSPAAGLTCQMHLRKHVLGGRNWIVRLIGRWDIPGFQIKPDVELASKSSTVCLVMGLTLM